MQDQTQEIYFIIVIGTVLALLLVGFIVSIFFLYQRKKYRQEQEMAAMKIQYEQELLRSQLEIQEETLKTIAQELHDNMGQVLSVVKLWLAILPMEKDHPAYEGVQSSRDMLNKVILDMANLTKSLHTDRIAQIGLVEAIHFELENLRKAGLLQVDFELEGAERQLDGQKAIFLFRMFQEMINNILKHSKATHVNVSIIYSVDNTFVLKVRDNGVGFDKAAKQEQVSSGAGLGLKSMVNRAKLIGGDITLESSPGNGTTVTVKLALETESV